MGAHWRLLTSKSGPGAPPKKKTLNIDRKTNEFGWNFSSVCILARTPNLKKKWRAFRPVLYPPWGVGNQAEYRKDSCGSKVHNNKIRGIGLHMGWPSKTTKECMLMFESPGISLPTHPTMHTHTHHFKTHGNTNPEKLIWNIPLAESSTGTSQHNITTLEPVLTLAF